MDGGASALASGEHDLLSFLRPDTLVGALAYLALFLFIGLILSRLLRATVHAAMTREGRIDRGGIGFVQQLGTALIWVMIVILYAHLIPVLRALGTAMLAGAGVASVVIGLAAQSTLGNLVAGISITIYRPFRLGDTLQVTTPTGTEIGVVEWISLGYTTLRTADGRLVVLPNSVVANQVNLNLSKTYQPAQTSVTIRCARSVNADKVVTLATQGATEILGAHGVAGCYLTKIDATGAVFDLRVQIPDLASRESTRARLLAHLAQRFAEADFGAGAELPTFS
jgi:small conductance mechanosensitive channel